MPTIETRDDAEDRLASVLCDSCFDAQAARRNWLTSPPSEAPEKRRLAEETKRLVRAALLDSSPAVRAAALERARLYARGARQASEDAARRAVVWDRAVEALERGIEKNRKNA